MFTLKDIINILKENPKETIKDALGALVVVASGVGVGLALLLFA